MKPCLPFVLAIVCLSCSQPPPVEHVVARFDDILFAPTAHLPSSTATYPRRAVADETRVVLHAEAGEPDETASDGWREHAAVEVDVPSGAALDLAYAVEGNGAPTDVVRVRIETQAGEGERRLLHEESALVVSSKQWHELRLTSLPTGRVRFVFSSQVPAPSKAWIAAPVLVAPEPRERRPNVVLVSLDTLRARQLSLYGNTRDIAPRMTELFGKGGVVVDRVLSPSTDTIGGHMAMLEGVNRCLVAKQLSQRVWHSLAIRNVAEGLRAAGYRTASFNEDGMLMGELGFDRGFESWFEDRRADKSVGHIEDTFPRGIEWLRRNRDRQFFLFLHTYEVHNPYEPPAAFAARFPPPAGASAAQIDLAAYEAEIAYTDQRVAALMNEISALGLERNTIVVVTADHGEEFGEHGRRYHGGNVTQEVLHVPLMLRAPGLLPHGVRRTGTFSLTDVPPTILDLVGLEPFAEMEGRSLAGVIRDGATLEPRRLFAEAWTPFALTYEGPDPSWLPPSVAATHWPWRMVQVRTADGTRMELFDLDRDPGEKNDVYAQRGAEHADLEAAVRGHLDECRERQARLEAALGDITETPQAVDPATPKLQEKLRALGYVQ